VWEKNRRWIETDIKFLFRVWEIKCPVHFSHYAQDASSNKYASTSSAIKLAANSSCRCCCCCSCCTADTETVLVTTELPSLYDVIHDCRREEIVRTGEEQMVDKLAGALCRIRIQESLSAARRNASAPNALFVTEMLSVRVRDVSFKT